MKKIRLKILTISLFLAALFITFSKDSKGSVSLINSSNAFDPGRRGYVLECSNGDKIVACGVGTSECTPAGQCGPQG